MIINDDDRLKQILLYITNSLNFVLFFKNTPEREREGKRRKDRTDLVEIRKGKLRGGAFVF